MAEDSMLWTTSGTGDGPGGGYTQQNWVDLHRYFFTPDVEGTQFILPRKGNKLAPTAGASSVNVDTGAAWVYGFFYKNTASVNVPIATPTLGTTGLRVVLRASWANQTVRATVIRNSDGVIGIPAATQTPGTTYDVTLATGTITNGGVVTLTDTRAYLKPAIAPDSSWVDGSTLEMTTADVVRVKDLGIATAKIANDAVDDTKAGNRVPQFYRRQGNDATHFDVPGTTNYTPTSIRVQWGLVQTNAGGTATITFPVAFSARPWIIAACLGTGAFKANPYAISASQMGVETYDTVAGVAAQAVAVWLAIGAE